MTKELEMLANEYKAIVKDGGTPEMVIAKADKLIEDESLRQDIVSIFNDALTFYQKIKSNEIINIFNTDEMVNNFGISDS